MPVATEGKHSLQLKGGLPPVFEKGLGVEALEDFDHRRHDPGSTSLMTGADSSAVITMKILVKQQIIAPIGVVLKLLRPAEYRPL
jgi:hypothetical protein